MSEAPRDAVLRRIRRSLGRGDATVNDARRAIQARLANPEPTLIPARADLDLEQRVELFAAQAKAVQATVQRIDRYRALPDAVGAYLRTHNLPMRLVMADDPDLGRADWPASMFDIRHGPAEDEDEVGLTTAFAGIAETGTVMLLSAPATPTTLAFLPETSIIVLSTARMLRAYEDGLDLLRQRDGGLPRSVNFITGPSRSGDIEQTLQLGAHGPRRLLILLVDEAPAEPE